MYHHICILFWKYLKKNYMENIENCLQMLLMLTLHYVGKKYIEDIMK